MSEQETKVNKIHSQGLKNKLYVVIFGHNTPAGKRFDLILICAIVLSVFIVVLDSVQAFGKDLKLYFVTAEWTLTILFTLEYIIRIYCSPNRLRYIFSYYGVIDLLAIVPTYLSLLIGGANYLLIIRLLRVLRIFRILKLVRYLSEANILVRSLLLSRRKILVFFSAVLVLATIFGCLMFIVEGPENGFTSIPKSLYWTIVTITTVGYGDITPQTILGQFVAALVMLTGYSIIAVPTGIFTAEIAQEMQRQRDARHCDHCDRTGHEHDSIHCRYCGALLPEPVTKDESF